MSHSEIPTEQAHLRRSTPPPPEKWTSLGAKKSSQTFFVQSFSATLQVMDVRAENHGRPHQKVRFPAAPVVGRKFLTLGHPGVRVRNVRGKSGPKSLCLCCFFFPDSLSLAFHNVTGLHAVELSLLFCNVRCDIPWPSTVGAKSLTKRIRKQLLIRNPYVLTLQPLFSFLKEKARETPKKATRVFLFAEPLKSLENKGKTPQKAREIGKQKKRGNRKKQGLEVQGIYFEINS